MIYFIQDLLAKSSPLFTPSSVKTLPHVTFVECNHVCVMKRYRPETLRIKEMSCQEWDYQMRRWEMVMIFSPPSKFTTVLSLPHCYQWSHPHSLSVTALSPSNLTATGRRAICLCQCQSLTSFWKFQTLSKELKHTVLVLRVKGFRITFKNWYRWFRFNRLTQ